MLLKIMIATLYAAVAVPVSASGIRHGVGARRDRDGNGRVQRRYHNLQ